MSNTEETTESIQKRSSYVDEFLESGRKKIKTSLSTDNQHIEDLEYMLKSVRALIKIIDEIWDKCEEHLLTSTENNKFPLTFERDILKEAKVEKKGRNLIITTQEVSNKKDFGNPPVVPDNLGEMINVGQVQAKYDILPDYNKYLEKTSILCEDVLLPFLTGFKEYLENVHVYLGEIEAWLIEPEVVDSFMNKIFDNPDFLGMKDDKDPSKIILYCSYCLDVKSKMESTFDICTEDGREVFKAALAFVKTFKPVIQIEVKDAGEKAVNGTYTLRGLYDGVYLYSRSGLWGGKPTKFYLNRQKNKNIWSINCKDASKNFDFFYWAESTEEECELPAMNGWRTGVYTKVKFKGVNPPPQILYKIDD